MTSITDFSRIVHILDRIDRIQYAETILLEFENEEDSWEEAQVAFDAILYDLLVIGEAVKSLTSNGSNPSVINLSAKLCNLVHHPFAVFPEPYFAVVICINQ